MSFQIALPMFQLDDCLLTCQDCGEPFKASDPDRKYCDLHLVERVNGAGIFEDDDEDELFQLHTQTCTDCGQAFSTSRRAPRCALCASLRTGQVGAATAICPACNIEHQVPILAPHKLCKDCGADLELTKVDVLSRLREAHDAADALSAQLDADVAHADEGTQARFTAAIALRQTGQLGEQQYTQQQVDAAWARALGKADDLAPLLALYDRAQAAALAQVRAGEAVRAVAEAMEG